MERWLARPLRASLVAALPAWIIMAYGARFHEPWRDEAQAMLLAHSVRLSELFEATHFEGTPPLFHAFLKLLAATVGMRAGLVAAGFVGSVVLLTGTQTLLRVITRSYVRSVALTWLLAFGDTYFYELGVIVRQYGLALGLVCFSVAMFHRSLERGDDRAALAGGAVAGLAAATATHAGCVAGGFVLAFALLGLEGRRRASLYAIGGWLPGFLGTLASIGPHPDRLASSNVASSVPLEMAVLRAWKVAEQSVASPGRWLSHDEAALARFAVLPTLVAIVIGALLFATSDPVRRKLALLAIAGTVFGAVPLLYIVVWRNWGGYRHWLFLWMPLVPMAAGWLAAPTRAAWARLGRPLGVAALAVRFLLDARALALDTSRDARWLFSETGVVANELPADADVVALRDWSAVGILLYRPSAVLRAGSAAGRRITRLLPDHAWNDRAPLAPIVREACVERPLATYLIVDRGQTTDVPGGCVSWIPHATTPSPEFVDETLDVARVDCACASTRRSNTE